LVGKHRGKELRVHKGILYFPERGSAGHLLTKNQREKKNRGPKNLNEQILVMGKGRETGSQRVEGKRKGNSGSRVVGQNENLV